MQPETRYARSGDVSLAYQVSGEGPFDLVIFPGWVTNLELFWEDPNYRAHFERLGKFSRLIRFDKRGTGDARGRREGRAGCGGIGARGCDRNLRGPSARSALRCDLSRACVRSCALRLDAAFLPRARLSMGTDAGRGAGRNRGRSEAVGNPRVRNR